MSPHPVAVAPDVDDVAVVQDPVDQRGRHVQARGAASAWQINFPKNTLQKKLQPLIKDHRQTEISHQNSKTAFCKAGLTCCRHGKK